MLFKIHKYSYFAFFIIITSVNLFHFDNNGEVNIFIIELPNIYYIESTKYV